MMKAELMVLAVDDDEFTLALLRALFAAASVPMQAFTCAEQLLKYDNLFAPAVILLDVKMPGTSGPQLQSQLRVKGVRSPIIFLTGSADMSIAVTAMRHGAFDFVEKPFDASVLLAKVARASAFCQATFTDDPAPHTYATRLGTLTPTEREVFDRMTMGKTSKEIAAELGNSPRTVEIHRREVMDKMAATHLPGLVRMAMRAKAAGVP